ncbi:hypothetical protein SAMN04487949_1534 [Halogranum gelatinilyticum]|uniref:Uncharacterized protein n=1 Tax=Halogranum gelatinilyticum TaxID=660521 RepID=A0A1G9SX74_9EURY|nr:hypothetical protein [Halogranum gelatinilyticum]SDM40058.1 hypothetical protein SAMN04487949_1534 [Halogranum gelatinilyticum]
MTAEEPADDEGRETDEQDWQMAPDSDAAFQPDPERVALIREIAEDVRGDSSESKQLAAILYRVSDLYDAEGSTSPEEIYLNVRHIMNIKEQGGIER